MQLSEILSNNRFLRYYYQINTLWKLDFQSVIEIGIWEGGIGIFLKAHGFDVTTVDIDKKVKPDIVADVRKLPDIKADLVCCFETLEHLPYSDFSLCLRELKRVSNKYVVISLPDVTPWFSISLNLPMATDFIRYHFGRDTKLEMEFPAPGRKFGYNGTHYWEIGKRDYLRKKVEADIRKRMYIIDDYRAFHYPYHHYYTLKGSNND